MTSLQNSLNMTGTILDEIVEHKRSEVAARKRRARPSFAEVLKQERINIIAEIKPRSPSAGVIADEVDVAAIAEVYSQYAAGISVLTDAKYFGGSLECLAQVAARTKCPVLCKEFVVDPFQIYEAKMHGASAVLLIAKILPSAAVREFVDLCFELDMDPVVEVQTDQELDVALGSRANVILINNRNLTTMEIDLGTTARLVPLVPSDRIIISASGIESAADVARLSSHTRNFLVGSSLMRATNIAEKLKELVSAC